MSQEQIRIDLANRITEARKKTRYFKSIKPKSLFDEIKQYPDFQELDSLQEKAAAIILGYVPVCLECGSNVKFGGGCILTVIGGWPYYCSVSCSNKSSPPIL